MTDDTKKTEAHQQAAAFLEEQAKASCSALGADTIKKLARMGAILALQAEEAKKTPQAKPVSAKILQFPLPFGENTRASSNVMARCALFAPVKERAYFEDYVMVGKIEGCSVEWRGQQLNQDDHDTLMQLIKMAHSTPFGSDVVQSVNAVLHGLNRDTRQEQRRQLFEQCNRLATGVLRLSFQGMPTRVGQLLLKVDTPENQQTEPRYKRHLTYQLDPKLAALYSNKVYTLFDVQERLKLKGRGCELAKWLHLWIISNAQQYPHRVETIHQLCGSNAGELYKFRQLLRYALELLKEAGVITDWHIDEKGLVNVKRTPSQSQKKHLKQKTRKATPKEPR